MGLKRNMEFDVSTYERQASITSDKVQEGMQAVK